VSGPAGSQQCPSLYEVEVEPEVRSWLTSLPDRDFGRVDFLVGLLAEHAEAGGVVPTIPLLERISAALDADLVVELAPHAA